MNKLLINQLPLSIKNVLSILLNVYVCYCLSILELSGTICMPCSVIHFQGFTARAAKQNRASGLNFPWQEDNVFLKEELSFSYFKF